jgi:hypothetical protein
MNDTEPAASKPDVLKFAWMGLAVLYVVTSIYFIYDLRARIMGAEARAGELQQALEKQSAEMRRAASDQKASTDALAEQLGVTQKDLQARAARLQREQQAAEARLAGQQKEQISAVTGKVEGVQAEVGSVKSDVAATKTELEATRAKLERAIGDLGVQSGLIARTREDLEYLRQKGERDYHEFTLPKGKQPTRVGTISLILKKTDPKKGKFTLEVLADDRKIEKKDRVLNEPMQFYTGRERQLFELVVYTVEKTRVTGYLSTPKTAIASR